MLACMPKRNLDDVSGELFIGAYRRQLGRFPNDAISFLTDKATATLKWFPTIADCLEILQEWRRRDVHTERRLLAQRIGSKEGDARRRDKYLISEIRGIEMTQADVDSMPDYLVGLGITSGFLIRDADGKAIINISDHDGPEWD